ncbi:MAG: hypothetical protein R3F38_17190 [Gammaproteobacteria bacterium]
MGYFDPLYRKDNIIGYTGTLNNNPTVYFVTECRDQTGALKTQAVNGVNQILFWNGHITQAHNDPDNVGREQVSESYSYSIANVGPDKISGFDPKTLLPLQAQKPYHQSEVPATADLLSDAGRVHRRACQPQSLHPRGPRYGDAG